MGASTRFRIRQNCLRRRLGSGVGLWSLEFEVACRPVLLVGGLELYKLAEQAFVQHSSALLAKVGQVGMLFVWIDILVQELLPCCN